MLSSSTSVRAQTFNTRPSAGRPQSVSRRTISARAMAQAQREPKQERTVKIGDKIPDGEFLILEEGKSDPTTVRVSDFIGKGKGYTVFFGLPGAYTSVCSSKHVPQFNAKSEELKAKGVGTIACLSVNDPWVMRDWGKLLGVAPEKVALLADGEGTYHAKLGLLQYMPGLGDRARRYSMLIDEEGIIKVLNIESPGGKSYVISGPDHMLADIANLEAKVHA